MLFHFWPRLVDIHHSLMAVYRLGKIHFHSLLSMEIPVANARPSQA
jgi:hypothetical protein